MSKGSRKRKGSEVTPTKTDSESTRRRIHSSENSPNKMAANTPVLSGKQVPWKTNNDLDMSKELSLELIEEIKVWHPEMTVSEEGLVRIAMKVFEKHMNKSFEFLHENFLELASDFRTNKTKLDEVIVENESLKHTISKYKQQIDKLENDRVQAELYSRRSNLQISGRGLSRLKHRLGHDDFRLRSWFRHVLNSLGCRHEVPIERIHWLGESDNLIIRFKFFPDRQQFWNARSYFSQSFYNMYVSEDFPHEIVEARKTLIPICKEANLQNPKEEAKVIADRLTIGMNTYTVKNLNDLPDSLQSIRYGYKESDDALVFFTKRSALSNHALTPIQYQGKTFSSVEQCWMYEKAKCFDDHETMNAVMDTHDPVRQKALGKNVKGLRMSIWKDKVPEVIYPVLLEKFKQNEGPRNILLNSGSKRLGEATEERYWGIGRKLSDPQVLNTAKWSDDNIVGTLLEKVRTELNRLGCY
jgi:hypothetical protein